MKQKYMKVVSSNSETAWKILGFHIHDRYPAITHLDVHLENGQCVYFIADNVSERIENPPTTTLQAFFLICQTDVLQELWFIYRLLCTMRG